ncbi:unnamed protein product [Dovyalis caffra]|uniref:Uncharacterized protein n=1 Tax=Dovyalis caffra TaxID=77055 RepID=A0AAV1RCJ5_9ROSI|nr:unnamed protein product [Dovyalis caffra]
MKRKLAICLQSLNVKGKFLVTKGTPILNYISRTEKARGLKLHSNITFLLQHVLNCSKLPCKKERTAESSTNREHDIKPDIRGTELDPLYCKKEPRLITKFNLKMESGNSDDTQLHLKSTKGRQKSHIQTSLSCFSIYSTASSCHVKGEDGGESQQIGEHGGESLRVGDSNQSENSGIGNSSGSG